MDQNTQKETVRKFREVCSTVYSASCIQTGLPLRRFSLCLPSLVGRYQTCMYVTAPRPGPVQHPGSDLHCGRRIGHRPSRPHSILRCLNLAHPQHTAGGAHRPQTLWPSGAAGLGRSVRSFVCCVIGGDGGGWFWGVRSFVCCVIGGDGGGWLCGGLGDDSTAGVFGGSGGSLGTC